MPPELLFWRLDDSLAKGTVAVAGLGFVWHLPRAVIVLCGLAPALSFVGWWDMYLSAALYSGNTPVAVVRISERMRDRLPAVAQRQVFVTSSGESMLPLHEWSMADLNVPPYPETRVYRQLALQMCALEDDSQELEFIVKGRPSVTQGSYSVVRFSCTNLLALRTK